jgi:hypothetical protein
MDDGYVYDIDGYPLVSKLQAVLKANCTCWPLKLRLWDSRHGIHH